MQFKKGDWVVHKEYDYTLGQLESDPYEISVYYEARPIGSRTITVVDFPNPDGPKAPVEAIRPATAQDFLAHIANIKSNIRSMEAVLEQAQEHFHDFLSKTRNINPLD